MGEVIELTKSHLLAIKIAEYCLKRLAQEGDLYKGGLVGLNLADQPTKDNKKIVMLQCKIWPLGEPYKKEVLVVCELESVLGRWDKATILIGDDLSDQPKINFKAEIHKGSEEISITRI